MAKLNKNNRFEFLTVVEKMNKGAKKETRDYKKNDKWLRQARRNHIRNN